MNFVKVISYNIWFEEILESERIESLLETLYNEDPDIICLQEVKPYVHEELKKKLIGYDYCFPNKIKKSYGCCIYSKYKISECANFEYNNSKMGRELLIVKIDYPVLEVDMGISKKDIIVANSHFESLFKRNFENKEKIEQYKESQKILDKLYDEYHNVIFCSDTNILDIEEDSFFPFGWKDCWKEKGKDDDKEKYTYDGKQNLYLQMRKIPYQSRLDRIIYKSKILKCQDYTILKGAKHNNIEPSDHFGIEGKFEINLNL